MRQDLAFESRKKVYTLSYSRGINLLYGEKGIYSHNYGEGINLLYGGEPVVICHFPT